MPFVFAKWAGKVFASLITLSSQYSLSNTCPTRNYVTVSAWISLFFLCVSRTELCVTSTAQNFTIENYCVRTCLCWVYHTHTLPKTNVDGIHLCHMLLGVGMGGFSRCVYVFFGGGLMCLHYRALNQKAIIHTRILSCIIVKLSSFGRGTIPRIKMRRTCIMHTLKMN